MSTAQDFICRHGLAPLPFDPVEEAGRMLEDMREGLRGRVRSIPMIPAYVSNDGAVPLDRSAVVIDAGGTNFRSALVRFTKTGYEVAELKKTRMPGVAEPCTWEDFIRFVADEIQPLLDRANSIGFCFSYSAEITPDMDGRVNCIDKEVVVTGSRGRLIGASLLEELSRRGISGKRVIVLNDTVAVLLGGASLLDKSDYSGFIGQVSGTGTNTCVSLPCRDIPKLGIDGPQGMLINLESGFYTGIRGGDIDRRLDAESLNPGSKLFEKLSSGAYLGELCRLALVTAADEGLLSAEGAGVAKRLEGVDGADVDAWARGGFPAGCDWDKELIRELSRAILMRSAGCMCVNLLALALLTGQGREPERPLCVCAEGSLVQKSDCYRERLTALLEEHGRERLGLHLLLRVGNGTTLPGTAAAALLN